MSNTNHGCVESSRDPISSVVDKLTVINAGDHSTINVNCGISILIANKVTVAEACVCVPNIQNISSVVGEHTVTDD